MPISTLPFKLKDTSLTLKAQGGATWDEYRCQLSAATLTPSATTGGGNELVTFCDTYSDTGGMATWTLDLSGFQAYADVMDLTHILFTEEGATWEFVLVPIGPAPISVTNPGFQGFVVLQPAAIGGTAQSWGTFVVSLPVTGRPTMITVPPAFV